MNMYTWRIGCNDVPCFSDAMSATL